MSNLKKILEKRISCKSVWFMRQAGRYLPEFRSIRSKNKDFIKLCLNSKLCSEITLQPINKLDVDSAIIFSDILMVPYALGQKVNFTKNQGPRLSKFHLEKFLDVSEANFLKTLSPVYKSIEITRNNLDKKKSLICFIGAPWTLLLYMLGLRKSKKEIDYSKLNFENSTIDKVIERLIKYLCIHIKNQVDAGANVLQIFDSWAGLIPSANIKTFCYTPNAKIVEFCKKEKIPSICFPKGIKEKYREFTNIVKPDGVNIDSEIDPSWANKELSNVVIQGGLDPSVLLKSDEEIFKKASKYFNIFKHKPYVFNLGHGLLPETDPDKVAKLIKFYRSY